MATSANISLRGPGFDVYGIVGQLALCEIVDGEGTIKNHNISIRYPGEEKDRKPEIERRGSVYKFQYMPKVVGEYEIKIHIEHSDGRPFVYSGKVFVENAVKFVTIDYPGIKEGVVAGKKSQFTIKKFKIDIKRLEVYIIDPNGDEVKHNLYDYSDEIITCIFSPNICGQYSIVVKYDNCLVPSCPIKVDVFPTDVNLEDKSRFVNICLPTDDSSSRRTINGIEKNNDVTGKDVQPVFLERLKDVTLCEGETLKLIARVQHQGNKKIIWKRNDAIIHSEPLQDASSPDKVVSFLKKDLICNDSGLYSCDVKYDGGTISSSCRVTVTPRSIPVCPKFDKLLDVQTTLVEGRKGELKVHLIGASNHAVIWKFRDIPITETDRVHACLMDDGWCKLLFNPVLIDDTGMYKVLSSNDIDSIYSFTYVDVVHGPPIIERITQYDVKVNPGDTICLQLSINDSEKYKVNWVKVNSAVISKSKKNVTLSKKGTICSLEIKSVQEVNTGIYQCVVTGIGGTSTKEFIVRFAGSGRDEAVRTKRLSWRDDHDENSFNHSISDTTTLLSRYDEASPLRPGNSSLNMIEKDYEVINRYTSDYGSHDSYSFRSKETSIANTKSMLDLSSTKPKTLFQRFKSYVGIGDKASKTEVLTKDGPSKFSGRYASNSDLLDDVVRPKPARYSVRRPKTFCVKDLTHEDIVVMERTLKNKIFDVCQWERLCGKLNDKYVKIEQTDIELCKHPGCRKIGKSIIQTLKTTNPTFPVKDLSKIAKKRNRNDICNLLKDFQHSNLAELSHTTLFNLEIMLSIPTVEGEGKWQILAADMDLDEKVGSIESSVQDETRRSSVEEMFNIIKTRKPQLPLDSIVQALREEQLNDSADSLEKIINNMKRKPPKRQTDV